MAEPFVAAEEERPVADNRSSDGSPKLVALEFGKPGTVRFALLVKKVSRIEIVIAMELIEIAVEFVAARFADGGDDPAGVAPILRAVGRGQHAKLPQHLDAEQVARGAARRVVGLIVDIGPVQKKAVGVHAAAAHAHLGAFPLIGIVTAAEIWSHARLHKGQRIEAAPVERQIADLFIVHQPRERGAGDFHQRCLDGDLHLLADGPDAEAEVHDYLGGHRELNP